MRTLLTALTIFVLAFIADSQGVAINLYGQAPDQSALLDVNDSGAVAPQGFLGPRMTTAQRDLVPSPVEGLEIYNYDQHCKQFYNGTVWVDGCGCSGENVCPFGMVNAGLFSVEDTLRSATDFETAVRLCKEEGLRLPRLDEWVIASDSIPYPLIGDSWEWISDAAQENNVTVIGGTGLGTTWVQQFWQTRPFRCVCPHRR